MDIYYSAILIGMLFIGANYYLWLGMGRIKGSERYTKFIKYLIFVIFMCFCRMVNAFTIYLLVVKRGL